MAFSAHIDDQSVIQQPRLNAPPKDGNKYDRGHALIFSGPPLRTGASRLSAQAALAVGAGLVTIVGEEAALSEHAAHVTAIMLKQRDRDLRAIDSRVTSLAIGPAYGVGEQCRKDVIALASQGRPLVVDADGLTSFEAEPENLFSSLHSQIVLTPHDGEFARLFPDISLSDRLEAATLAAKRAGAVVLLKGAESIVAGHDGRHATNKHADSWLATAGSGDVLTGLISGIMAQGLGAYRAACAAAWIHGDIALRHGPGLTAERMIDVIPAVLQDCLVSD